MKKKLLLSIFIAASISCGSVFANTDYLKPDYQLKVLQNINNLKDVKKLNKSQLDLLADDLRYGIINHTNSIGGHLGLI